MSQNELRPAPLITAVTDLGGVYCSAAIDNPEFSAAINLRQAASPLTEQGIGALQAARLRARFGLSEPLSRVVASHVFEERPR